MTMLCHKIRHALILLVFCSTTASAYTLSFAPGGQTVTLGNQASVSVWVDGVLPGGLGNYDFDVLFDPAILSFDRATDGVGLGFAMGLGTTLDMGQVVVSDFSLDDPVALLATQSDRILLFSLVFDTLAVGRGALSFDNATLGDVEGNSVNVNATALGAIDVTAPAQVPEPSGLVLLMTALAALGVGRLKRR